jgi:ribosomal protein S18 acetylase RimI-like enzyme
MIRAARPADATQLALIHQESFHGFFLTSLGPRFLRLYYRALLGWPDGSGMVYVDRNRIVGFAVGVVDLSSFYRHLLTRRGWQFALYALPRMSKAPTLLRRLRRAMSHPRQAVSRTRVATLTSVAVEPQAQGRDIGKQLIIAFLEEMQLRKVEEVNLTTDRRDNESVNRFYEKLGFSLERFYSTSEGREINEYAMRLDLVRDTSPVTKESS